MAKKAGGKKVNLSEIARRAALKIWASRGKKSAKSKIRAMGKADKAKKEKQRSAGSRGARVFHDRRRNASINTRSGRLMPGGKFQYTRSGD